MDKAQIKKVAAQIKELKTVRQTLGHHEKSLLLTLQIAKMQSDDQAVKKLESHLANREKLVKEISNFTSAWRTR